LNFCGIQKTSLIDFPNNIASVLFTPKCNLRCPYCYNWRIVLTPKPPYLSEIDVVKMLENRKKFVDAVVITGGEPTIHKTLPEFLMRLKEKKFKIKLDTNGFFPEILEKCLPFVNYVALDIKTSLEKYHLLGARDTTNLKQTINILKKGKVNYEFRMTVVPNIVTFHDLHKIGKLVEDAKTFVIQQFVPGDTLDKEYRNLKPYPPETILSFSEKIKKHVSNLLLRV
jgi:pyruvate formate lyase activating enzyme